MNRSDYDEDLDHFELGRWRGVVASAIRGKRGQAFLREMVQALDAMPAKRLIAEDLVRGGEVCALGSVGAKRGVEMGTLDPEDYDTLGRVFDIATPLVREIEWVNDEVTGTPEERWAKVRAWAFGRIKGGWYRAP